VSQWKQLLEGLEQNPARGDLASGVMCICRTLQNPVEQAGLLTECAVLVLPVQPMVGLQMIRIALLLAPRHPTALKCAREIFKRRGRWAAEQRVSELMATLTNATAVSPPSESVSQMNTQTMRYQLTPDESLEAVRTVQHETAALPVSEPVHSMPEEFSFDVSGKMISAHEEPPQEIGIFRPASDEPLVDFGQPGSFASADFSFEVKDNSHPAAEQQLFDPAGVPAESVQPEMEAVNTSAGQDENLFALFLEKCSFDPAWLKFSTGFNPNLAGLVAYVNLLMTMKVIDETDSAKVAVILYKMIKDTENHDEAEKLFERLFVRRSAGGEP
jgi:hypothetical protein